MKKRFNKRRFFPFRKQGQAGYVGTRGDIWKGEKKKKGLFRRERDILVERNRRRPRRWRLFFFYVPVCCHIYKTANNIFLTLVRVRDGKVLIQLSGGNLGKKGPKRDTPNTAELLGRLFGMRFNALGYNRCVMKVEDPFDAFVRSALRGISSYPIRMLQLRNIKGVSHNGVRLRNPRKK